MAFQSESAYNQLHSDETNSIPRSYNRKNTLHNEVSRNKFGIIFKIRKRLYLRTHSRAIPAYIFALFTSIIMIVGILTVCFTSLKESKTCQMTFKRMMTSSLISSSQPRSIAVGDFNSDYFMDLVVANSGTNTIGVFISKGHGTFVNQQIYSTGPESHPYSIITAKFNNDTYLDIAVANYGTHTIGLFIGNGNGTFLEQNVFSVGSSRPSFITFGDLNMDNRMDIVVANYGTNSIDILIGNGNGSFQDYINYSTGYDSMPSSLVVGDFNRDHQQDIAVTNYGTDSIVILFGYGNGTFSGQITYTTILNSHPSSIAIGDFNNDNYFDIIVANYGTSNVGVFLNRGDGTFASQRTYSTGPASRPQFVAVGYFDKNRYMDMIVVGSENDQIYILPGYGNGTFAKITTYDTISGSRPFSAAITDFDNDSQSDIALVNYNTNNILILTGYTMNPSATEMSYLLESDSRPSSVGVADFNNDSYLDVVVNNFNGNSIFILTGTKEGTFTNEITYSTGNESAPQWVIVADLNNDNQWDIATANLGSGSVGILLGFGDGTFTSVTNYPISNSSMPFVITSGDINNDNQLDLATANYVSNDVAVFLGHGNGTFADVMTYSTGVNSLPLSIAIGDVNNDNRLDIVTANFGTDSSGVLLGCGNGTFGIVTIFSTGNDSQPTSIVLADFNNDNYLDIVVTNSQTYNIGILFGRGDGSFGEVITCSTGSASLPYSVTVTDYNNDKYSDIAVSKFGSDEVVIFFSYGNGSLELARRFSVDSGSSPYGLIVVDLNKDNQSEIIVAFWGTGKFGVLTEYNAAEFAYQTQYSTGSAPHPYAVAVGDFNKDNRSDIVVAYSGTSSLGILLGLGNGSLMKQSTYLLGMNFYPQYVLTGDVDKDNNIDIVTANSLNGSISIIRGYGNGTFASQAIYSTGDNSYPYGVAMGDFNNDNRSDFVIANSGTNSIGILIGFNYASFQVQDTYSSPNNLGQYAVAINDFNNDQYLDIAAVCKISNNLVILLGSGNGSFGPIMTVSIGSGSQPFGLMVSDFNNDGRADIATANCGTNNIGILLGYGNGSFGPMITYSTGNGSTPYFVAVGDFNKDNRMDIVAVNYGTNNIGIFLNYGDGSFATMMPISTGDKSTPYAAAVADFNNDNQSDIVVANCGTNSIGVLLGNGNGTFEQQVNYPTGYYSQTFSVAIGDFNNDSQLDVATANNNINSVGILLGCSNGTFGTVTAYSTGVGSGPSWVDVGDFNNDEKLDLAVINYRTSNFVVLFGFGDGSFLLGKAYSTGIGSGPNGLAIGDFNNDSQLDIAVASPMSNDISVFLGRGHEPFADVIPIVTINGSQPHSVAVGNFNNDNLLDIVIANYGADNISILFGYGNGNFGAMMTYSTGVNSAPYSVAVGDFNKDNHSDIVVTNYGTDNIAILFGDGNGTFIVAETYATGDGSLPNTVAIYDFDNNNISDIIIANSGTNNVIIFYGGANGSFRSKTSYDLGYDYHPYSIASTDLNQDGLIDIVVACYNTDNIETLIKMC